MQNKDLQIAREKITKFIEDGSSSTALTLARRAVLRATTNLEQKDDLIDNFSNCTQELELAALIGGDVNPLKIQCFDVLEAIEKEL